MRKVLFGSLLIIVIIAISITSFYFIKNKREDKKQELIFEELQDNVIEIQNNENIENKELDNEILNIPENKTIQTTKKIEEQSINLLNLYIQNQDIVGWIRIDGTSINYPVMQNGTFYLRNNFYKNYSRYGTPFLAEYCDINNSNNLIVYGHNIKNGNMFADLLRYRNKSYYSNHNIVKLYYLQEENTIERKYEIISVFETSLESSFKYYSYYDFRTEEEFNQYYETIKNLSSYDTEVNANFGDNFLTLSTCSYSRTNGRMVVVSKEIK